MTDLIFTLPNLIALLLVIWMRYGVRKYGGEYERTTDV